MDTTLLLHPKKACAKRHSICSFSVKKHCFFVMLFGAFCIYLELFVLIFVVFFHKKIPKNGGVAIVALLGDIEKAETG